MVDKRAPRHFFQSKIHQGLIWPVVSHGFRQMNFSFLDFFSWGSLYTHPKIAKSLKVINIHNIYIYISYNPLQKKHLLSSWDIPAGILVSMCGVFIQFQGSNSEKNICADILIGTLEGSNT